MPFHKNRTVNWTEQLKKKSGDVTQCKNTPSSSLSLDDLMFGSRTHSSLKNYILEFSHMFLFPLPQMCDTIRSKVHTAMLLIWCLTCSPVFLINSLMALTSALLWTTQNLPRGWIINRHFISNLATALLRSACLCVERCVITLFIYAFNRKQLWRFLVCTGEHFGVGFAGGASSFPV